MKKGKTVDWFDMPENLYRASQLCRILGNPKSYQILSELRRLGAATPSALAPLVQRSISTVSGHLKTLREVHIVRYQKDGQNTLYRLKSAQVEKVMDKLDALVSETRTQSR